MSLLTIMTHFLKEIFLRRPGEVRDARLVQLPVVPIPELFARRDEDGLCAERLPQEAESGGAREGQHAPEQPYHELSVPPSEQRLLSKCRERRGKYTGFTP